MLENSINRDITIDELGGAINQLKRGNAVSEDLIANEFLRSSGYSMRLSICHLFKECLKIGAYPWNTSLVTPLHKKGSIQDPNNYRAIAVASNLGKLFSMILLQRLVNYRAVYQPDTPNQLGFCKGAQTSDHILTLTTCIDKYTKGVASIVASWTTRRPSIQSAERPYFISSGIWGSKGDSSTAWSSCILTQKQKSNY